MKPFSKSAKVACIWVKNADPSPMMPIIQMFRELAADHLDITDDKIVALVDAFMVLFENVNFRLTIMCLSDIIFFT